MHIKETMSANNSIGNNLRGSHDFYLEERHFFSSSRLLFYDILTESKGLIFAKCIVFELAFTGKWMHFYSYDSSYSNNDHFNWHLLND